MASGTGQDRKMDGVRRWQLRFDGGRQQRYFDDRQSLLECVTRIGSHSPDPRFEVWAETEGAVLSDGQRLGCTFQLAEVLDLGDGETRQHVWAELQASRSGAAPVPRQE